MSRFMLTAALLLGSVFLAGGSARASQKWFGPYDSQAAADAVGQGEIDNNAAGSWGAGYQPDDPTGGSGGEGYYVLVTYLEGPAPGPQPKAGDLTSAYDEQYGPYTSKEAAEAAADYDRQRDDLYDDAWAVSPDGDGAWYVRVVKKRGGMPDDEGEDGILGVPFPGR